MSVSETIDSDEQADGGGNPELTLAGRILILQEQHRELDEQIQALYEFPFCDQLQLQRLKKKKLRMKDSISRLKGDLIPDLNA